MIHRHVKAIYSTQPRPTRNPALLRFTDPELVRNQKWIPLHVERLLDPNTPENVKLALITFFNNQTSQP